ncbi:Crp/Fnr family transcriptional regulator [Pedobacter mendelii]|uniref:Crp/Fnr family transcriptional regulator n=1 Tax=Pedobacter mendelii TaxID=1908240 RepID=UPI0016660C7D|nr:cyclic nucleotide-binding domain-containing protein [Pedobacter mendelii]
MTPFIQFLTALHPLSPAATIFITNATETIYLNRGETLFPRGKIAHKFCFIESGSLAAYRPSEEKNIATRFWLENQIVFCTDSLVNNQPLIEKIVALEECKLNCISFNKFQTIITQHIHFCNNILKIVANEQIHYMEWTFLICTSTYEDRYLYFRKNYNKIFNLISAEAIASSLNMSGSKLSRLRKMNH